jgi:hypothetical protein
LTRIFAEDQGFQAEVVLEHSDHADDFKAVGLLGNKVLNNEIRTRTAGVEVLEADSTHISGNRFESIGGCSQGIVVQWDSDSNLITE